MPLIDGKQDKLHDFAVSSWQIEENSELMRIVDDVARGAVQTMPSTITDGEWTLVYAKAGALVELYHNFSDPKQENNVVGENEKVAHDLHSKFVSFLESTHTKEGIIGPRRNLR